MAGESALSAWLTWAFSPSLSAIIVTLLVSLSLPILIHIYLYRKAVARELPTFLLLGPSGGGKTSLLTLFTTGTASATHTSQAPQTAQAQLPSSTQTSADRYRSANDTSSRAQPNILIIDTPGHGKLRHHALSSLRSDAPVSTSLRGLLFVVDSAAVSAAAGLTEAAEFLHDVLLVLQKRHTGGKTSKGPGELSVLVLANKQDVFTSLPAELVKGRLEAEIGKVRATRSRGLLDSGVGVDSGADGDEEEGNWLGEFGSKEFEFGQMREHGVEIALIGGNVKGDGEGKADVEEWWKWIGEQL